jgi:uncharacterized protein
MTPVQFEKISIFKLGSGEILGFHNENLEIAQLSPSLFLALNEGRLGEELVELKAWSDSVNCESRTSVADVRVKTLTINSTQLCNLKCTYCAAGGDGTYGSPVVKLDLEKSLPQLEWLMARCLPGERFQINFVGGEPLLYPEILRAVAEKATALADRFQLAPRFAVVTNGTRFGSQKVIDVLIDFRMVVTVSIDGPPDIQDQFRPKANGQGSSVEVEQGLNRLKEIKNKLPAVGTSSVFHEGHTSILKTYEYLSRWNFDFYDFNFSHTDFVEQASLDYCLGLEALAQEADRRGGEEELRKIRGFDNLFQRLDEQLRIENFCGAGKSLLSMDARGDLYTCPWDINEKQLRINTSVGVNEDNLKEYHLPQISKSSCSRCWAKYLCGGGCHYTHKKSTGSVQNVDAFFCQRTQKLIFLALTYFEKYRRIHDETH